MTFTLKRLELVNGEYFVLIVYCNKLLFDYYIFNWIVCHAQETSTFALAEFFIFFTFIGFIFGNVEQTHDNVTQKRNFFQQLKTVVFKPQLNFIIL